jgi:heme-degrading monooxygenase HmoA
MESQVIPLLRKQKGFRDELTLLSSNGNEATAISIWDSKEDAEAYNRTAYSEVLRTMEKVIDGKPTVDNCEVSSSTFHKIAGRGAGTS